MVHRSDDCVGWVGMSIRLDLRVMPNWRIGTIRPDLPVSIHLAEEEGTYDQRPLDPFIPDFQSDPSTISTFSHFRYPSSFFYIDHTLSSGLYTFVKRLLEVHIFRHSRHGLGEGWEVDSRCGFCIRVRPYLAVNVLFFAIGGGTYDHLIYGARSLMFDVLPYPDT